MSQNLHHRTHIPLDDEVKYLVVAPVRHAGRDKVTPIATRQDPTLQTLVTEHVHIPSSGRIVIPTASSYTITHRGHGSFTAKKQDRLEFTFAIDNAPAWTSFTIHASYCVRGSFATQFACLWKTLATVQLGFAKFSSRTTTNCPQAKTFAFSPVVPPGGPYEHSISLTSVGTHRR
ncbi:hypothetical protein AAVH_25009 [Aphelenchoides avenae]|nr:hypothetical protein AAVH_25009 [Aphelenchus avenae]